MNMDEIFLRICSLQKKYFYFANIFKLEKFLLAVFPWKNIFLYNCLIFKLFNLRR